MTPPGSPHLPQWEEGQGGHARGAEVVRGVCSGPGWIYGETHEVFMVMGVPQSLMVYNGRSYLKWMIWGYSLLGNRYMYIIYIHTWKMHRLMIPLELRSWKVAQYFTIYDVHFHL